jgi:tRNA(fMet)-specific endonuclease VapC
VYIFDTDVLSAMLRGRLPDGARESMRRLDRGRLFTTAVTLGELYFGALRSSVGTKWLAAVEELQTQFAVLPFDTTAARRYGELRAYLERLGRRLDDADLRIAAIASATDRILVSGNERHFARVPRLRYENWLRKA